MHWKNRQLSPEQSNRMMQTWGMLEVCVAMGECVEFDSHTVLGLDTAMPVMIKAMEHINA